MSQHPETTPIDHSTADAVAAAAAPWVETVRLSTWRSEHEVTNGAVQVTIQLTAYGGEMSTQEITDALMRLGVDIAMRMEIIGSLHTT